MHAPGSIITVHNPGQGSDALFFVVRSCFLPDPKLGRSFQFIRAKTIEFDFHPERGLEYMAELHSKSPVSTLGV
jgi:hypothetical protein